MDYTKNALGRFVLDSNFSTSGISFVVGLCANLNGINPEFKGIVERTHNSKLPLLAFYPYEANYYTQFFMDREDLLPPLKDDIQFQNLTNSLKYKTYSAVVIDISSPFDPNGKPVDPQWITWGSQMFVKRVSKWLAINKPTAKLLLSTNDEVIKKYSPNMPEWITDYDTFVNQRDVISGSYPTTKPRYYSQTWQLWKYWTNLVLFNGDKSWLNLYLNYNNSGEVVGPDIPPKDNEEVKIKLDNIILQLQELKKQL
jgi:hypothetical protein